MRTLLDDDRAVRVDLYWLPLGAGGHSVRWNGRVFEAIAAARDRRPRRDLYHSALVVTTPTEQFSIELAPAATADGSPRPVVAHGPVGLRWAGRCRWLRYEVRCSPGLAIPDIGEAVQSPHLVSTDAGTAQKILDVLPRVPTLTWGRDEAGTGEMWNSNSLISWVLQRAGVRAGDLHPPMAGRAPGWEAGIVVASTEAAREPSAATVTT